MPNAPDPTTVVYFENRYVPLAEANINILTHGLHYGTGVFDGIRGYWCPEQRELFVVRLEDHMARWKANCRVIGLELNESVDELSHIVHELAIRNQFETDIYVRPLAYMSSARVGVSPDGKHNISIIAVPFGVYIDSSNGLHAGVVTWRRLQDDAIPSRAKICGAYVNSVLATTEAHRHGYDEAILLNESGRVAEGATCNLFMVRNGKLITPPGTENILEGLTRDCVMQLARRELQLEVIERPIGRSELYFADELFFTGTAVEIAPIVRVDNREIGTGAIGPVTKSLRQIYRDATHGGMLTYHHWLSPCYQPVSAVRR